MTTNTKTKEAAPQSDMTKAAFQAIIDIIELPYDSEFRHYDMMTHGHRLRAILELARTGIDGGNVSELDAMSCLEETEYQYIDDFEERVTNILNLIYFPELVLRDTGVSQNVRDNFRIYLADFRKRLDRFIQKKDEANQQ